MRARNQETPARCCSSDQGSSVVGGHLGQPEDGFLQLGDDDAHGPAGVQPLGVVHVGLDVLLETLDLVGGDHGSGSSRSLFGTPLGTTGGDTHNDLVAASEVEGAVVESLHGGLDDL